jgi:hypothetical protein
MGFRLKRPAQRGKEVRVRNNKGRKTGLGERHISRCLIVPQVLGLGHKTPKWVQGKTAVPKVLG